MAEPLLPLVVVLGPTASGKSQFALQLARRIGAEIVGADSRQVYRGMDIGTGKVEEAERRDVPHYLIDVVDPDEPFGLADYLARTRRAIADIRGRGRIPLLVGGSGQYVWAVVERWEVPRVAPDRALRERLEFLAKAEGAAGLHGELARLDPAAADAIHPHNVRRVVRALEVAVATGRPPSSLRSRRATDDSALLFGLSLPRAALYARIDARVEAMIARGFAAEVEGLLRRGYGPSLPSMSSIGYTQMVQFLCGELTLAEAAARIKAVTHRFARQQAAWFRADDPRITWLAAPDVDAALRLIGNASPCNG